MEPEVRMSGVTQAFPYDMVFGSQLTKVKKQQAVDVLTRHRGAFEEDAIKLSCTSVCKHRIDIGNSNSHSIVQVQSGRDGSD